MPLFQSNYNPPFLFRSGHFATIYSGLFRKVEGLLQTRERIDLPDGDFLDLDWSFSFKPTDKVVILLHGLEGNAQRPYITGSAKAFNTLGYDACSVNFRGCSGETNKLFRSYHSGATEDLDAVVRHIVNTEKYPKIFIKGVSLGGNMALKYAGEGRNIPKTVKGIIGISVPCDLHSSLRELLKPKNFPYAKRFKNHLVEKLIPKQKMFPDKISANDIASIRTLKDFDDIYTSRAHGFINALDYYKKCSCLQFLGQISIPALIISAKNDSFLGKECYPIEAANTNPNLSLEMPRNGGHVGFFGKNNATYTEKRAVKFCEEVI